MEEAVQEIKDLVHQLNEAGKAYYQGTDEIMSNFEYDALYDKLLKLEKETGIILSKSPSIHVGYEVMSGLPKERHESPMLSLDKTKDVSALKEWLGEKKGFLSWKLDGLTIMLAYHKGKLKKAVTRGNGEVGEVITNNARMFKNLPISIQFKGDLIIRGEAVIKYSSFAKINEQIDDVKLKYKNPRNLCSGSVRQLNNEITAKRQVHFFAFSLVEAAGVDFDNSKIEQMKWLKEQGFDVVEGKEAVQENLFEIVDWFSQRVIKNDIPSDGLVLVYDDISYGRSLGTTAKFPRDSIAFKWVDEIRESTLLEVEWSASRTGLINPIAVFEPVELEGSSVSRASVHNVSILENLELGIGDTITIYKANMIIPQIGDNLTRSGTLSIPECCPICKGRTKVKQVNDVKALYCLNEECQAKKIKSFTHFVSRSAMNIEGLSEATIEKLINKGIIKEAADLFHVEKYKSEVVEMEGFGEKSFTNLAASIEKARNTTLDRLIFSLGISNIGLSNAKLICRQYEYNLGKLRQATREELAEIDGIGEVIADAFISYFEKECNRISFEDLLKEVNLQEVFVNPEDKIFNDMAFVITGSLNHFENRDGMKEWIERRGGRVTGSVTKKTNYLINNDNLSLTSKNKKAKELGVTVITENELLELDHMSKVGEKDAY